MFILTASMNSSNAPSDDDQNIWENAFHSLTEGIEKTIHFQENKASQKKIKSHHNQNFRPFLPNDFTPVEGNLPVSFSHPSLPLSSIKKIFKYPFCPQLSIDLHHMSCIEAYTACQYAISQCQEKHFRKLHLICGKGHHTNGPSKLKGVCVYVLSESLSVLAYQSSHLSQGGTGAIDVFLKK